MAKKKQPGAAKKGKSTQKRQSPAARKKNVLITGVTGTLGSRLAEALYYDKNVGVIMGAALGAKPYYFNQYDTKRFRYKNLNILRSRDLKNLFFSPEFKEAQINTVVHLAFFNRASRKHVGSSHTLNVQGTNNLLEQCIETKSVNKFIFKSSDVVYKIRPHNPIYLDEHADLNFDTDVDSWIKDRVDEDLEARHLVLRDGVGLGIIRGEGRAEEDLVLLHVQQERSYRGPVLRREACLATRAAHQAQGRGQLVHGAVGLDDVMGLGGLTAIQ